jgi:hypothetical protein
LLVKIPYQYTIWEEPIRWRHISHGLNPHLYYMDSLHLEGFFRRLFLKINHRGLREEAHFLVHFFKSLNVSISEGRILFLIKHAFNLQRIYSSRIAKKMRSKRIRLLILVNHYDPMKMLITSIAKSLGVYVVELQHGNMGRYHIAYNFAHNQVLKTLPHEIFTFGSFWNRHTRISRNGVILTAVGMPWFEARVKQVERGRKNGRVKILILSQEVIGHKLGRMALELSKKLNLQEFEIYYKLHPKEYKNWQWKYPSAFVRGDVKVYAHTDLYHLLSISDIHIGVYSTTVVESLVFNKCLILFESYGVHYFTDLIQSGRAFFARNVDEIIQIIYSVKTSTPRTIDVSDFWETESKSKMWHRIKEILG